MKRLRTTTTIAAVSIVLGLAVYAFACHPSDAAWCKTRYESAGDNTVILLDCHCGGNTYARWYVGFFTGDQPTLRQYAEIQNTASDLIR